jgi:tRNA U34 5-methylaminomethyl-2-thiouridine-forming methyltransferase MnmC
MNELSFILTADGSKTLFHPQIGEHYHSIHGAVQESRHVFLESGLDWWLKEHAFSSVSVLEVGFGTGLNFLLSAHYCMDRQVHLFYTGIEAHPLTQDQVGKTDYESYAGAELWKQFNRKYKKALRQPVFLSPTIQLEIIPQQVLDFETDKHFDLLYYDAFSATHQPEMWTEETLGHVCRYLHPGGLFVTYAVNRELKRNLDSLGFRLEKARGSAGKREMLRATRT